MKSQNINLCLVSLLTIILIFIISIKMFLKKEFFIDFLSKTETLQYFKNISAQKITRPNDSSFYGFTKSDKATLGIKDDKNEDVLPIVWSLFEHIFEKVNKNDTKIKNLQADIFSATKETLELMGKLEIRESSQITDAL